MELVVPLAVDLGQGSVHEPGFGGPESRRIEGQGTPEALWRAWDGLERMKAIDLPQLAPQGARVVVVAPHPDDEVLGCGGALAMLSEAGHAIHVIGVTDGEGSHPGSREWPPARLAATRRGERLAGLDRLGAGFTSMSLGIPDGRVSRCEAALTEALGETLQPSDVVFTTWRFDGHPDHEVVGRVAVRAARERGCRTWEMPIWMWHWASPGDARVAWASMRCLSLTPTASHRKASAIAAHGSQLAPVVSEQRAAVLPAWAVARLLRPFEIFLDTAVQP